MTLTYIFIASKSGTELCARKETQIGSLMHRLVYLQSNSMHNELKTKKKDK